jgi:hypothetical protein
LKIVLGTMKDQGDEVVAFLEPRVGGKPTLSGGEVEIADESVRAGVKPRHVKTYLKRFLHRKGLRRKYRVLIKEKELTLQELEFEEEEEKEKAVEAPKEGPKPEKVEEAPKEAEVAKEAAKEEPKAEEKAETKEEAPPEEKKEKPKPKKAAKPKKQTEK